MRNLAPSFLRSFVLCVLALAGCTNATTTPGADSGGIGTDSGTDGGSITTADTGIDGGSIATTDTGVDAASATTDDAGTDAASTTVTDAATTMGCLFHGTYRATNILCNGVPYSGAAALTPPAGSWVASDDGTVATFAETIGTCSLIATGHIDCDSPTVGEFTHHPDAPLACSPAACTPFTAACSGGAVGAEATWSYVRNADGSITTTTSASSIQTCTAGPAPQGNPLQITWVIAG